MKKIVAALAFLWAGIETSGANYCRPEWPESIHYPQYAQAYPPDAWISPETVFAIIATAIVFFVLGKVSGSPQGPDKQKIISEIESAFRGRQGEAVTHGRDNKLRLPLDAALTKVKDAVDKAFG